MANMRGDRHNRLVGEDQGVDGSRLGVAKGNIVGPEIHAASHARNDENTSAKNTLLKPPGSKGLGSPGSDDVASNRSSRHSSNRSSPTPSVKSRSFRVHQCMDPLAEHLQNILEGSTFRQSSFQPSEVASPDVSSDEEDYEKDQQTRHKVLPQASGSNLKGKKQKGFFQRFRKGKKTEFEEQFGSQLSLRDLDENFEDGGEARSGFIERIKVKINRKPRRDLNHLARIQVLGADVMSTAEGVDEKFATKGDRPLMRNLLDEDVEVKGPIWSLRFSEDGKYLAAGGQDSLVRVWRVAISPQSPGIRLSSQSSAAAEPQAHRGHFKDNSQGSDRSDFDEEGKFYEQIFEPRPFRIYKGHTAPILDVTWSKNGFLATASMDKTVRVWHVDRDECLCSLAHRGCVTSLRFHPIDDRYLLTGSLDTRIRVWSLEEKRVCAWNETPNGSYITAVSFSRDGALCIAGTFDGDCIFYEFDGMKYNTQIEVKSSRERHGKRRKITGIEPMPEAGGAEDRLLVTANDSRVRLYNVRDKSLQRKFKGLECRASQIKATFSDNGRFIIAGSEDRNVYLWNLIPTTPYGNGTADTAASQALHAGAHPGLLSNFIHWQNDTTKSASWEKFVASGEAITCAIFAPTSTKEHLAASLLQKEHHGDNGTANTDGNQVTDGMIIVAGDLNGRLRVFQNSLDISLEETLYMQHSELNTIQILGGESEAGTPSSSQAFRMRGDSTVTSKDISHEGRL